MIATRSTYIGLFLVTLATLMFEILLTRIFSVTMWYHFAFMAISVAMFGMTVGALLVYLMPGIFRPDRAVKQMAFASLGFSVTIVISFLVHLNLRVETPDSFADFYPIALTYLVISLPFIFSGTAVCLALTRFPQQISKLYAVDLAGAAVGCISLIFLLRITDGLTAVFAVAFCAAMASLIFSLGQQRRELLGAAALLTLVLASVSVWHTGAVRDQNPLFRLRWVKTGQNVYPIHEKWNSFSRIAVSGKPNTPEEPFGWGLSSVYPSEPSVRQLRLNIDASAETILTAFSGDWSEVEHLKYDITNLAHYIRPDSRVLVVGAGGGRDVLSALAFDQKSVVAVEINEDILDAVNGKFGDFTGHLDQNPKVLFVNDEARSYIARQRDPFDMIQISLIDTWAATAAGALVLTENSLYTLEAWKLFLERLTPRGVLSISRWYHQKRRGGFYRLTSLATASLLQSGIQNPREHIVILRNSNSPQEGEPPLGVGTMLVGREPFSAEDLHTLKVIAQRLRFELILTPNLSLDPTFTRIASGNDLDAFTASYPMNISPPTDDRPFFFYLARVRDFFSMKAWQQGLGRHNLAAVRILVVVLITVVSLTGLAILLPLLLVSRRTATREAAPLLLFFTAIGCGFMLVEISQMQRLIIFLGHPTYSLSVVLFSLLLAGGIGSYLTQKGGGAVGEDSGRWRLITLLCVLALFGAITPALIRNFETSTTPIRILVAGGILIPIGIFMGMAFPLGMSMASARVPQATPWLWGINGATSVCASVFAVAIALSWGISVSYWTGCGFYALALISYLWAAGKKYTPAN